MAGAICGGWLGWTLHARQSPQPGPRKVYDVVIEPSHMVSLWTLGNLTDRELRALADYVNAGFPFRGYYLERRWHRGGFLTHTEYVRVRDELERRHMAYRRTDNKTDLLPPARAFFKHLGGGRR